MFNQSKFSLQFFRKCFSIFRENSTNKFEFEKNFHAKISEAFEQFNLRVFLNFLKDKPTSKNSQNLIVIYFKLYIH